MSHRCTQIFLMLIGSLFLCSTSSVQAQINANFSVNTNNGCTPLLIQFTDLSTSTASGIATWQWDFGDNTNTTVQNPAKVYNTAGLFDITLIVTDSLGNADTLTKLGEINVSSSPVAEFEGLPTVGCSPVSVQFNDLSTPGSNPINSWSWTFGTGASSSAQNPQFTYTNPNSYTVSLTVSDANGCSNQMVKSSYIKVADIPTAGFTASTTQFCTFPATANFANTSSIPTGVSVTYEWDFGDNSGTSTAQNPSYSYGVAGTYDVTLIVTDTAVGCADTLTQNDFIQIFANSSIAFTNTPSQGCDNVTVQFTNATNCPSSNWNWDFGDGSANSSNENPSHTYSSPGTYDVIFSALVDGILLSDTCIACVTVDVTPSVDYTTTGTIATCHLPISAAFAGTSNNPNATYSWDFGDGTGSSNMQNPSYTYNDGGTYPVSLTVTSPEGCSNTIVKDTVFARPIVANFIENRVSSCIGGEIDFIDSTESYYAITSWVWDFEDTTSTDQNPTITFQDTGTYDVSLIVTNTLGCIDTIVQQVEVGDSLAIDFSVVDTIVCIDEDIVFTNLTDPSLIGLVGQWSWDFGDGGSSNQFEPTYAYSDTGTFTVILTGSYNNCDSKVEKVNYIVVGPPISDFEADRDCAAPLQVTFIDKSIGANTYHWDFGVASMTDDTSNIANPVFNYPNAGNYAVKLTVTNNTTGCSHELTQNLILNPAENVVITLSDTAGCTPLAISVSNTSSLATYNWTAPGATISDTSASAPTLTYSNTGVYDSIKVIVTHPTGCVEEIVLSDTIRTSTMLAAISVNTTSGCAPLDVTFTDNTFNTSPIVSYVWDFDDGDTVYTAAPLTHTYTNAVQHNPTLTVTDSVGCTQTASINNAIVPTAPFVDFISDTIACTGQAINFANLSTGVGLSHSWDFDDGTSSNQTSPSHTYTTEGTYNACLTVTDINGCSGTSCRTIVIANPVANFNANNTTANCSALSVQFNDLSQNATSWFWDFGDSTTSALQNPVKVYSTPGSYDVTLIVTSLAGCQDTIVQAGFIQISGPSADFSFTPNAGCPGTVVNFTATGINVDKFTFVWGDFTTTEVLGTGGNDTITISHTYDNGGVFTPAIQIEDNGGCQLTQLSSDSIVIEDFAVTIDKSIPFVCDAGSVQLDANISSLTPVTSINWTYGTPSQTSTANTVNMNVSGVGVYPISLTASNASCTRTVVDSMIVYEAAAANFGATPQQACVPQLVQFTDSSTIVVDTIVAWAWTLNGTVLDSVQNTSYQFNTAGTNTVDLVVTTNNGCTDTLSKIIEIFPNPTADAGTDVTICEGENTPLSASGGTTYTWNTNASLSCTNCANPIATPTFTTDYIVTVIDANGCSDIDTVTVFVNPKPVAATPTLPYQDCEGTVVNFIDGSTISSGSIVNWNWNFGAPGGTSTMQNVQYTYTSAGNFNAQLIVTSDMNCSDTISGQVIINQKPTAIVSQDAFICQGGDTTITVTGGVSYLWSPSATLSCDTCTTVIASPLTTTNYVVTVTAANGCTDTDTVLVEVSPFALPPLTTSNDTTICAGDIIQIFAYGGTSPLDYTWDQNAVGLSCYSNCSNPFASPTTTTSFIVTLTGQGGCEATDTITVTVIEPTTDIIANDEETICQGESIQLNTILGTNHNWTPFEGLSCVVCPNPIASPDDTMTYYVTADAFGCQISDTVTINVVDPSSVSAGDDVGLCLGNSVQLNATGVGNVTWSPSATLDNPTILNPIATPTVTTTYYFTLDNGTCLIEDSVTVNILSSATIALEDVEICEGESVVLPVDGLADSYVWTPSESLDSATIRNPVASPSTTTTYSVTANLSGCNSTTRELTVTVIPQPTIVGLGIQEVFYGNITPVQLDVETSPTYTYNWWSTGGSDYLTCNTCPDPSLFEITNDAMVYVQATNNQGCMTFDSIQILVIEGCDENSIIMPNAFTPNGDGLNDILYVRGTAFENIETFQIYSRNGEKVFESNTKEIGWDGTFNNNPVDTGVFVYFVEATCPVTGNRVRKQGNVTVLSK